MMRRAPLGIWVGFAMCSLWAACSSNDSTLLNNGEGANGQGAEAGQSTTTTTPTGTGGQGGFHLEGGGQTGGHPGCDPQTFTLEKAPPAEIFLVIDKSGSMDWEGSTQNVSRWSELVSAVDAALAEHEGSIDFGLLMYPTGDQCEVPSPQVAPATNNHAAIMAALSSTQPLGGTPTAMALNAAADWLQQSGDADKPDFLILATDGGPNCNTALSPWPSCSCTHADPLYCCTAQNQYCSAAIQCLDDQRTLDVIASFHSVGIDTFVIGLPGTDNYVALLDEMAVAGGRPQQGADTSYYAADDPGELLAALQTIAGSVISCVIDLGVAPEDPDGVLIFMDGGPVPRDETKQNGWDYTDDSHTSIELYGSWCDTLQNGDEHSVTATFPCEVT